MSEQVYLDTFDVGDERSPKLIPDGHLGSLGAGQIIEHVPSLVDDSNAYLPVTDYHEEVAKSKAVESTQWTVLDSGLHSYEHTFTDVLKSVDGKLVNLLPQNQARPVVVLDIMATTVALEELRDEFLGRAVEGAEFKGFAVGLAKGYAKSDSPDLHFIQGNARHQRTWNELTRHMNGLQADLIMERAVGGLRGIPHHRKFYEAAFATLWPLLRPGGVMLLQTPDRSELALSGIKVKEVLLHLNAQGIEARTDTKPWMFSDNFFVRKPLQSTKS